jgi:cell wall assembly regulator SMI1
MMKIAAPYPPVNEARLDRLQAQLGATLPAAYRRFLLRHNGGRPSNAAFDVPRFGRSLVNDFLAIDAGDHGDLMAMRRRVDHFLPPALLAVADDPAGNLVCIALTGAMASRVFFCCLEEPLEANLEGGHFERGLYPLADDFDAFLALLQAEP